MSGAEHIGDDDFENENPFEDFDDEFEEIDDAEREALHQDLLDVKTLKGALGSRGIKGVVVFCPDCDTDHFLGWDLLAGNLQQILEAGRPPVHEPAWQPDPDEYVTWDYARGFLDGFEAYPDEAAGDQMCGYCASPLPEGGYEWGFCPSCGKDLAPLNLIRRLVAQGWSGSRIRDLLDESGFERPLIDFDKLPSPFTIPGQTPKTDDDKSQG